VGVCAVSQRALPRPLRADGYRAGPGLSFPPQCYVDPRVAVLVPYSVAPIGAYDVVVVLHDFRSNVELMLTEGFPQGLVQKSGVSAVFVVPQGPKQARDGYFGKLSRPGGLLRLLTEVQGMLEHEAVLEAGHARPRRLVLLSLGGGFEATMAILRDPRQASRVAEVDVIDGFFGDETPLVVAASREARIRCVFGLTFASQVVEALAGFSSEGVAGQVARDRDTGDATLSGHKAPLFILTEEAHEQLGKTWGARLLAHGVLGRR